MQMRSRTPADCLLLLIALAAISGCSGPQSALDPAGEEAHEISLLFWAMFYAGALIWALVAGAIVYALWPRRKIHSERTGGRLILWGGAIAPSLALLFLLAYALWLMPGLRPFAQTSGSGLRIEVTGKQFWWEVIYHPASGDPVIAANEVVLPAGERVELTLKSGDVIHSFWIPSLGGKMDMIPGRTNRLSLMATRPGTFRGPCAEYCGTSHALMTFIVTVMDREAFAGWLGGQRQASPGIAASGADLFRSHGCGACHRINGTAAQGKVGPDLSHVGSRKTLAAGIMANTEASMIQFITRPQEIKPGQHMPAFDMLPAADIAAMAAYLKGLQ